MTDTLTLALLTALTLILLRAIIRQFPYILAVGAAMLLSSYAPLERAEPWRDVVYANAALIVPFAAFGAAFAVVVSARLWGWYVNAKRKAAHDGVDKAHDAMLR